MNIPLCKNQKLMFFNMIAVYQSLFSLLLIFICHQNLIAFRLFTKMKGTIMNPEKREDPKNPKGVKNPHILVALCLNQKKVSVIVPLSQIIFMF